MSGDSRHRFWLGTVALVALLAAVYHPVAGHPFVWTDHAEIEQQTLVPLNLTELGDMLTRAKGAAKAPVRDAHLEDNPRGAYAYYRPTKALSYGLDWALGGGQPWSFHLTNLFLHLAASLLLLLTCRRLFGDRLPFLPESIALLHAVMPVHVEAVSWISARSDVLWGLFTLAGILLLLRSRRATGAWKRWGLAGGVGLVTMLAAGSKESGLAAAAILVAFSAMVPDRRQSGWLRRVLIECPGPLGGAALYLVLRFLVVADIDLASLGARAGPNLWTVLDLLGRNLLQSFIPLGLSLADTLEVVSGPTFYGLLGPALLAVWFYAGLRLRRSHPVVLFCAAGWLLSILPVSQIFPLLHPRGERYLYVPAMFAEMTLLYLSWSLAARLGRRGLRRMALAGGALVMIGLGLLSHVRTRLWADERLLFSQAVVEQPNCAECWNNLAFAEAVRGNYHEAELACRKALSIDRTRYLGARDGFSLRFILIRSLLLQGRGHQAIPWIWQLIIKGGRGPANLKLLIEALGQAAANRKLEPGLLFVGN